MDKQGLKKIIEEQIIEVKEATKNACVHEVSGLTAALLELIRAYIEL